MASFDIYLGLAIIAIFIRISFSSTDINIPKRINVFRKSDRSLEIQAEKEYNHPGKADPEFEPCHSHVVQFQLVNHNLEPLENGWELATYVNETAAGRFLLYNLNPGTEYWIRVACFDTKFNLNSSGISDRFSRHIKSSTNEEVKKHIPTKTTRPPPNLNDESKSHGISLQSLMSQKLVLLCSLVLTIDFAKASN